MGIFDPIWKTDDEQKQEKAIRSVRHVLSRNKLNKIALSAPLREVKRAALRRLQLITHGEYRTDAASAMDLLLTVDIDQIWPPHSPFDWYVEQLLRDLSAEQLSELVQKAANPCIRMEALIKFSSLSDEESLIRLGSAPGLTADLRREALAQITWKNGRQYKDIALDASIPQELRSAAQLIVEEWEEIKRIQERQRQKIEEKRQACKKAGHKWKFVKLTYKMSGMTAGREALYRCENCGEEWRNFIEGNTDSV